MACGRRLFPFELCIQGSLPVGGERAFDGSSKFPTDQQWAFFPSVSGGWRVSEEAFWKVNPELFSNLKIRASYGSLGNGNVSPYSFLELLSISTSGRVLNGLKNK